jgi:hypothetical protein
VTGAIPRQTAEPVQVKWSHPGSRSFWRLSSTSSSLLSNAQCVRGAELRQQKEWNENARPRIPGHTHGRPRDLPIARILGRGPNQRSIRITFQDNSPRSQREVVLRIGFDRIEFVRAQETSDEHSIQVAARD